MSESYRLPKIAHAFMCDWCRYRDSDGAGHFMCSDYSPPWLEGESAFTSSKIPMDDELGPKDLCLGFMEDNRGRYV